jgi:hypothetical protein
MRKKRDVRWNCTLVENGARRETLKLLSLGMCVAGSGPLVASVVKLRAVMTMKIGLQLPMPTNREKEKTYH